jgi:hypothetical protein
VTRRARIARTLLLAPGLIALSGCMGIGAQRMGIDRTDYADHLRETNKQQLLRNIVGMRYGDAPLFLEVSSVISQYTREGSVHLDVPFSPAPDDAEGSAGGSILLRETPTITYAPLSGDRFARSMLTPISPASLLAMIESGWSTDYLFPLAVRSINGVANGGRDPLFSDPGSPEFARMIAVMARLQRSSAINMHIEHGEGGRFKAYIQVAPNLSAHDAEDLGALAHMLNLPGGNGAEYSIAFGGSQTAPGQLAIGSRSMFEIFAQLSQGVEIPPGAESGANTAVDDPNAPPPLIRIHSGNAAPADAHVAARYRGHWYWIDGNDERSKRFFLITQVLLSLNDTSGSASAPLVTIPAG